MFEIFLAKIYFQPIVAMLAVINPAICGFMVLQDQKHASRKTAILHGIKAMIIVTIILVLVALGGQYILRILGIPLDAFRIFGGFILIAIGFHMMVGLGKVKLPEKNTTITKNNGLHRLVIFAASPATIAMAITLATHQNNRGIPVDALVGIVGAIVISMLIISGMQWYLKDRYIDSRNIGTRFVGLIIVIMGFQFIFEGFKALFW